jgi:hypothetical protein
MSKTELVGPAWARELLLARYVPASLSQPPELFEVLFLLQKGNWVYAIDLVR